MNAAVDAPGAKVPMFPRPTGKKPSLSEVLDALEPLAGEPVHLERLDDPLLDHLLVAVLSQHTTPARAREAIRSLSEGYLDFNELRVSGKGEIEKALEEFVPAEVRAQAAWDVRMALQDVYDQTHGLDLEPLRGRDPEDLERFANKLPNTAGGPAAMLFQLAVGKDCLAMGPLERRLLERLELMPKGATAASRRKTVEKLVKPADRLRFAWIAGACARLYEKDFDAKHPFCRLLVECRSKELPEREKAARLEAQRLAQELKRKQEEEARLARLALIEQRKKDALEKKRQAELARKQAIEERKRAADEKRKQAEAERKKASEARKREAEEKRKKAEAERKKAAEKARLERERAAKAKQAAKK
ncbi:MAG: hypothetical protein ACKOSS_05395, partial [Planctomycetia bacterium]